MLSKRKKREGVRWALFALRCAVGRKETEGGRCVSSRNNEVRNNEEGTKHKK